MKHFILILFAAVAIQISACKKDNNTKADTTLTGKWKLVRNKMSSGGPMYWVKATNVSYALFNTDGTLDGTAFNDFKFYTLKDSVTLTLNKADKTEYEDYRYNIKGDSLTMSPLGPVICIEGCAMQFIKE